LAPLLFFDSRRYLIGGIGPLLPGNQMWRVSWWSRVRAAECTLAPIPGNSQFRLAARIT